MRISGQSILAAIAPTRLAEGGKVPITFQGLNPGGAEGAFVKNAAVARHVRAFDAGPVVETTGAGDAFNGGLAVALSEGKDLVAATRFGCAVAGISVTRHGTAPSMPNRAEVDALLRKAS